MGLTELFVLAIGLAMDAFAVSICKGLALGRANAKSALTAGVWFGGFQALMPAVGYFLGAQFSDRIDAYDHWIAFALLLVIGLNMIRESLLSGDEEADASLSIRAMFPLAIATSIDALAVGVTFAVMNVNIIYAVIFIGVITFVLSGVGVFVGSLVGGKYKSTAERVGGAILILLGLKILLEHLGIF